jgi:hypothetical protein
VYRADVLRYLTIDGANSVRIANGPHTVKLRDSGGNGNGNVHLTNGATLVIVYRVVTPGTPLRSVVIYDGAFTLSKFSPGMSQDVAGFYQASDTPGARMTHIVGNGQPGYTSSLQYPGGTALNAFTGTSGGRWDNPTFNVTLPVGASTFLATTTSNDNQACMTWAAVIASTNVADFDEDGLLDKWETNGLHLNEGSATAKATFGGCSDYPGEPCVDLPGMHASVTKKDLFLEIDWLRGDNHLHVPKLAALNRIGARFAEHGIQVHFDVGNYSGNSAYILPYSPSVPRAGGEAIDESLLGCPNSRTSVCTFPNRPYAVLGWKIGFRAIKEGFPALSLAPHFSHNRKDIFHYVLFSHALAGPFDAQGRGVGPDPWSVSGVADRFGGDLMVSLGLWRADNPQNCDPTIDCDDLTGSELIQAGTLLHELGHNLGLSHAGANRTPNCEPNYQSTMNYLYQTRGLTDSQGFGQIDFSSGGKPDLLESALNLFPLQSLQYRIRFFGPPNPLDLSLNRTTKRYCSNGLVAQNQAMRLESSNTSVDWANGTTGFAGAYDVNFDGITNPTFKDFDDWGNLNLRQIGARANVGGLSADVGQEDLGQEDLGQEDLGQEDLGQEDLGQEDLGQEDLGQEDLGDTGNSDVDFDTAISTLDATSSSDLLKAVSSLTSITLNWGAPSLGQIRQYKIFRTADPNGVFPLNQLPLATLTGAPPARIFVDTVDSSTTLYNTKYTYFVQSVDINGTNSGPSTTAEGIVKHLFVAADDKSRIYGVANSPLTFTVKPGSLDPGLTGTTTCSTTALPASKAGTYPITCSGLTPIAGVTYYDGTLTILGAPLTITARTNSRTYNGTLSAAAIPQVDGLLTGDTVTGLAENYTDKNAGTGKTLVVSSGYTVNDGNNGANYIVTTVPNNTGVISPAPVTASITASNKTYDKTNAATVTGCSLTGVFTVDAGTVGCTGSTATFASANAGTWTVTATVTLTGNALGNYYLSSATAATNATIIKATPIVTATGGRFVYDGAAHPATGSVTGVGGEFLGVPAFVYNPGGAAAPVEVGSYQATGSFAGNTNYFGATSGTVSIKIDGFMATGPMATARSYHTATLLPNGNVLVAGGLNASGTSLASSEVYNPTTGTFASTVNNMPNKGVGHTATLLNTGKVLVAGGGNSSSQLYDYLTNTWSSAGGMSSQRSYHTATVLLSGKVLIAGGSGNNGAPTNSAQIYDPATGNFTATGNMTSPREFQTATLLSSGKVLIAGGRTKSGNSYVYLASAELYDPATGVFTAVATPMARARYGHVATVVTTGPSAGMILIVGGANTGTIGSSELYNPATGTFTSSGSLGTARQYFTATPITSGVLVVGGLNGTARVGTGEQYQGSTFVPGGLMKAARAAHTATLLNNGSVLIVGGQGSAGVSIVSAELFVTTP